MFHRIWQIASKDFVTYLCRPLIWVWIGLLALIYWGICSGEVMIAVGGDSEIGGKKQHLSSEFEITRLMTVLTMILHGFFGTVLFGMAVIRDFDARILPLFNSSQLTPRQYLVGKFLGCLMVVLAVVAINALVAMLFMFPLQPVDRGEYFGEFKLANLFGQLSNSSCLRSFYWAASRLHWEPLRENPFWCLPSRLHFFCCLGWS